MSTDESKTAMKMPIALCGARGGHKALYKVSPPLGIGPEPWCTASTFTFNGVLQTTLMLTNEHGESLDDVWSEFAGRDNGIGSHEEMFKSIGYTVVEMSVEEEMRFLQERFQKTRSQRDRLESQILQLKKEINEIAQQIHVNSLRERK